VHEVELTHDTPFRLLYCVEDVLGLATTDQLAPFQDSIRVWSTEPL
jgi:hypothetical protein